LISGSKIHIEICMPAATGFFHHLGMLVPAHRTIDFRVKMSTVSGPVLQHDVHKGIERQVHSYPSHGLQ
jgi:hypothetical protein